MDFHSRGYIAPDSGGASASDVGSGAYVRLSHPLVGEPFGSLGLSIHWTSLTSTIDSGEVSIGHPIEREFTYTYDRTYRYTSLPSYYDSVVLDAVKADAYSMLQYGEPRAYRDPRKSQRQLPVTNWTAVGHSFLEVRLNEVFLSADAE